MQKLKRQQELSRNRDEPKYSFQPDVKDSVAALKGERAYEEPLYKRFADIQKQKDQYLSVLRAKAVADNPDLTFHPKINQQSEEIANEVESGKGHRKVTERLMNDAYQKVFNKLQLREQANQRIEDQCTFQPEINPISQSEALKNNPLYNAEEEFVTRQVKMEDRKREMLEQKQMEHRNQVYTFEPHINRISDYLMEADEQRVTETQQQKNDRLSKFVALHPSYSSL